MGLNCPDCHQPKLFREKRAGFLEKNVFPKIGLYPWKCSRCGKKVFRFDQGYWRHKPTPRTRAPQKGREAEIGMVRPRPGMRRLDDFNENPELHLPGEVDTIPNGTNPV